MTKSLNQKEFIMIPNRNTFQHLVRGLTNIPHVGRHPGIPLFFILFIFQIIFQILSVVLWDSYNIGATVFIIYHVILMLIIGKSSIERSKLSDYYELKRIEEIEKTLYN